MLIPLSHLPAISRRPLCALELWKFSPKRSEIAEKCEIRAPSSFIVAHSTLLTRSHCDHLRSRCDSSTLSTHSYCALYALSAPKSPSLRFHYVLSVLTTCALRLRYACIEYSATSSVYFSLSVRHNKNKLQSHLSTIMVALPLRVLRYKSARQSEIRSLRAIWLRVKSGIWSPWATWSAKPWRFFWIGSKQAQRVGALARAIMTQYSRYGSAKGTTWAYWERIKSVWKRLWVPLSSHVTGIWDSCTLIVLSIRAYILFIVPLSRFHY